MITSNCTNHVFLRVFCALVCICPISCSAVSLSVLTVIRPESRVTEAAVASLFLSFCLSLSLFSAVSLCPSDRLWCCPVVFTTDQWLRVTVLSLQQNETNIDNTSNHSMTRLITLHFLCFCSLYGGDFWPLHQHGCYLKHSVNVFQCCAVPIWLWVHSLVRAARWFLRGMFKSSAFCYPSS